MLELYDEATTVTTNHGHVVLDGPGRVSIAMTVQATLTTCDRLLEAAAEAHGQQIFERRYAKKAEKRQAREGPEDC